MKIELDVVLFESADIRTATTNEGGVERVPDPNDSNVGTTYIAVR